MNIQINLIETATELAHKEVERTHDYDATKIYKSVSDCITEYTHHAQIIFDVNYDYFYNLLWNLKTN